jgi:hypothetical protein
VGFAERRGPKPTESPALGMSRRRHTPRQLARIDVRRYYIDNVGGILAVFHWIVGQGGVEPFYEPPMSEPPVGVPVPA